MKCIKYKKKRETSGWRCCRVGKERSFIQQQRSEGPCGSRTEPMHQPLSPSLRNQQQPLRGSGAKPGWQLVLPGKLKVLKSHLAAVIGALPSCNHLGLSPGRPRGLCGWWAGCQGGGRCALPVPKGETQAHRS